MLLSALLAAAHLAAAGPADEAPPARPLGFVLEPGEARVHTVALELNTRVAVRTGDDEVVRQTSTRASFCVSLLGLRRASAEAAVVELVVGDFNLSVLSRAGPSVIEVTMDEAGMTMRRDGGKARRVPWADVPRGRGGEVGELIGRPMWCTFDRHAGAVKIDARMLPWSRVLDSMDLLLLLLPPVPLPALDVAPGTRWTVTSSRPVALSEPWGEVELETRTDVSLVAFEEYAGREAVRLTFSSVVAPVEERPRFTYELSLKGEVLLGLDGAVLGGEASVSVAASATVLDAQHELAGAGTVQFNPPAADESH